MKKITKETVKVIKKYLVGVAVKLLSDLFNHLSGIIEPIYENIVESRETY